MNFWYFETHLNVQCSFFKVLQHMEDVKVREMQIFDYKKKIAEAETKLKQQQNLYEAVRSDRNLYSKNLIESQDEITEMKRKLKIMNHQIDQLKEEISSKEAMLVKEHLEHQRFVVLSIDHVYVTIYDHLPIGSTERRKSY